MPKEVLKNVPKAEVGKAVQKFIDFDDKKDIMCKREASGLWTIEAS